MSMIGNAMQSWSMRSAGLGKPMGGREGPLPSRRACGTSGSLALAAVIGLGWCASAGAQTTRSPAAPSAVPAGPPETGVWLDHTTRGAVEIRPCGGKLCGHIHWLHRTTDKAGKQLIDDLNPEKRLRGRPICGLQVIGGLARQANGSWDNGWIYDPEKGEKYDLAVQLQSNGKLRITGYLGVKWLSESHLWTRAKAELASCAVGPAGKAGKAAGVR